jgi:hypothetical protein
MTWLHWFGLSMLAFTVFLVTVMFLPQGAVETQVEDDHGTP